MNYYEDFFLCRRKKKKRQEEVNINPETEGSARKMTSRDTNTRQMLQRNFKLHYT